jgi:hypothetical protein
MGLRRAKNTSRPNGVRDCILASERRLKSLEFRVDAVLSA